MNVDLIQTLLIHLPQHQFLSLELLNLKVAKRRRMVLPPKRLLSLLLHAHNAWHDETWLVRGAVRAPLLAHIGRSATDRHRVP